MKIKWKKGKEKKMEGWNKRKKKTNKQYEIVKKGKVENERKK